MNKHSFTLSKKVLSVVLFGIIFLLLSTAFSTLKFNSAVLAQTCAGDTMDCGTPQRICRDDGEPCQEGAPGCVCTNECLGSLTITCVYTPYMRCNDQCFSGCVVSGSCSWSGPTQAPPPPPPPPSPIPTSPPGCGDNCGDGICCSPVGENQSNCPADCGTLGPSCWHCSSWDTCSKGDPNGAECNCYACLWSTFTALVFVDLNEDGIWSGDDIDARVVTNPAHVGDAYDLGVPDVYIPGLQLANSSFSATAVGNVANADYDPGDFCDGNVYICDKIGTDVYGDVWNTNGTALEQSCYGRTRCCGMTNNCWGGPPDCKSGKYVSAGKLDLLRGRFNSHVAVVPYYTNTVYSLQNLDTNQWEVVNSKNTQTAKGCDTDNAWFALRYKNDPPIVESTYINSINDDTGTTDQMCLTTGTTNKLEIISFFSDPDEPNSQNQVKNGSFENSTTGWTLETSQTGGNGSAYIVSGVNAFYGSSALKVDGGTTGAGYYRAIQSIDLEPGTSYSFTATYKSGTTGTAPRLGAHIYCNGEATPRAGSTTFNQIYPQFTTVNNSFTTTTCDGQFTIYIFSDAYPNSWMILDGIFLRKDSSAAEIYSDIQRLQINIEKQDFPTNTVFSGADWPVRLGVIRLNNTNMNKYRAFNGSGTSDDSTSFSYDLLTGRWYLPSDLYIDSLTTIKSSNPDPPPGVWNTFFQYAGLNTIFARWIVEVDSSLLDGTYHITGWVDDFLSQQDELDSAGGRTKMPLTIGATTYTWQRFGTLETIQPSLTVNFVESEVGDDPSGDYCPYRAGGTAVTLNGATVGVRGHEAGGSFVNTAINNISNIIIQPNICEETYDIKLTLNPSDGYVCNCQTGANRFECIYSDVPATYLGNDPINFYLLAVDLTNNAWFQSVGGQITAKNNIRSNVPFNDAILGPCISSNNCWPALITWLPWSGGADYVNTPGFPFTHSGNVITHTGGGTALIHENSQRTQSADGHASDNTTYPSEYNYQYFYNKFGRDYDLPANQLADPSQPILASGLNVKFAPTGLNISEPWLVESGQQLIVFVTGDLSIQDTIGNRRMIQVDVGGYLAFIVSGNISINADVGYSVPNTNPIVFARPGSVSPNVEGIYLADGTLTIASNGNSSLSDKKFIGAGTFVGWSGISLARSFSDGIIGMAWHNYNPTETFIYRPDFLLNTPSVMKESIHEWREVAPRAIN